MNHLPTSRRHTAVFGLAWVLLATLEFWGLGSFSFVEPANGVGVVLPTQIYVDRIPNSTQFSQAIAGGNDLDALINFTGQAVSIERILLRLPLPIALFLHAVFVSGVGYFGAYRLSRAVGAPRPFATAVAAAFIFGHDNFITDTWAHGVSLTIAPLLVYMSVFRWGRPRYLLGTVAVAALFAASSNPTHTMPAAMFAVFLGAAWVGWRRILQVSPSLVVFAIVVLANWLESLWAKAQVAPFTLRGSSYSWASASFEAFLGNLVWGGGSLVLWPLGLVCLALLVNRRGGRWLHGIGLLALSACAGVLLNQIPWRAIPGLGMVSGLNLQHTSFSALTMAVLCAAAFSGWADERRRRMATAAVFAIATSSFVFLKCYHLAVLLSEGGISPLAAVEKLDRRVLDAAEPSRVVTVPYRLSSNMLWSVGLDTFDGTYNLVTSAMHDYWTYGILPRHSPKDMSSGFINFGLADFDMKCCTDYDIAIRADLDLLRIANVDFILSILPLTSVQQVGGPTEEVPVRRSEPIVPRLKGYARQLVQPPQIRVYRLGGALPRVFAASGVAVAPTGLDKPALLDLIRDKAIRREAVMSAEYAGRTAPATGKVTDFHLLPDKVVAHLDAPDGAMVLINIPYTGFWQATVDGKPTEITPANLIHMAVSAPPGSKLVELNYHRSSLTEKLFGH
ncbi:hypothetical protein A6A04_03925 [Paramagnetospirillum marisnigri]|uniref:Glycosyltransferase RgtA/B/C/D-like domain-containing protein n=2 Tax=Paramagnetospirillum marisnigri TaxID=1285242 RepID=A0A178ML50_9PROT|nr:hypothetical protein A6A04_03925 [Paramagnetospirillum marisnigri]